VFVVDVVIAESPVDDGAGASTAVALLGVFTVPLGVFEENWEPLGVAPRGVNRELVATVVIKGTDDPTRMEYEGKKSSIC
jgi:hypothetical protein